MKPELAAFESADFGWVRSPGSIWGDGAAIAGPNQDVVTKIIDELEPLSLSTDPRGRVLLGQAGIGKTHLIGALRQQAWNRQCWFISLDVVGITDFWKSTALSFITSLLQQMPDGRRQFEAVIEGVARRLDLEREVRIVFAEPTVDRKPIIDALVRKLTNIDRVGAITHHNVFRALAFLSAHDLTIAGVAHAWLQGFEADEQTSRQLGFLTPPPSPIEIVKGLLWTMGLSAPALVAIDQVDGVLASDTGASDFSDAPNFTRVLTSGFLDLDGIVNRGIIVLTCLLSSWETIKAAAPQSLLGRYRDPIILRLTQSEDFVRQLIADRLAPAFAKAGIKPLQPTWPFTDAAIRSAAQGITPRTILMRCDEHRRRCLSANEMLPCNTLSGESVPLVPQSSASHAFDETLKTYKRQASLDGLLDDTNDQKLGSLLCDAFDLYTKSIAPNDDYDVENRADPAQRVPPLHGRIVFTDHRDNDRERHFCFRALQHANAVAFSARLRAAHTAAGIAAKIGGRKLILVRRGPPPTGPRTRTLFRDFELAGGTVIYPSDDDLRTFVALRQIRDEALAGGTFEIFRRWLEVDRPLCTTRFFNEAGLVPPPIPGGDTSEGKNPSAPTRSPEAASHEPIQPKVLIPSPERDGSSRDETLRKDEAEPLAMRIPIGRRASSGDAVELDINVFPRHTAIIAGAGSGKTVLLRRLVEEAALAGIPSIVIDPNNDLSRLGDSWPQRPEAFTEHDALKASRFADTVNVVVWTPGIHAGNPLFLPVLPDFAAVGEDPDERAQAVAMASDTLAPLAGAKTNLQKGVLADAVRAFASVGGGDLKAMTTLLEDLPDGASEIGNSFKHAAKMADELKAAIATNPLLKVSGPVLDPSLLFFGADKQKTRISVINLSGLASDDAKQDFINRLQMTLFGWIKKHPSPRGLLYVIDEAQNFVPSGQTALSKNSGIQLVAQARKYGLGMIVVTQAPRGIDNKVVSNCTTQFLGKQNSPTDQNTVKQMISATGGNVDDIGKLSSGEFYFKTEKSGKPYKVKTPLCLSYHPANPPTPEDVIARAKASKISATTSS